MAAMQVTRHDPALGRTTR